MIKRRRTKTISIGAVKIGSGYPVSIQSMAKTDTTDVAATLKQIKSLEKAGCEIIRVALKNTSHISALKRIKSGVNIPIVADIHFNYRLGLEAIACGVDGLRLNPGNIYRRQEVKQIAQAAKKRKIPIRVGVNAGSLRRLKLLPTPRPRRAGKVQSSKLADLMVASADEYINMLESFDFYDILVSLKASDVGTTVSAYKKMAELCDYPFHLGITATGLSEEGTIKSAMGIGSLLLGGIGDTIRVSLTATAEEEVKLARKILQSLDLRNFYPEIVSCPTCGRAQIDVVKIAGQLKNRLSTIHYPLSTNRRFTIAIMGCEVNGPGEASNADLGIAGGKDCGLLFRKGKIIKKVPEKKIVKTLLKEIDNALV